MVGLASLTLSVVSKVRTRVHRRRWPDVPVRLAATPTSPINVAAAPPTVNSRQVDGAWSAFVARRLHIALAALLSESGAGVESPGGPSESSALQRHIHVGADAKRDMDHIGPF